MRNRAILWLTLFVIVCVRVPGLRAQEPSYGGVPLKEWVKRLHKDKTQDDARKALVAIGAPAVPALLGVLQEKDVVVRRSAADVLGEIGAPAHAAVPALAAAITSGNDSMGWVAGASVRALGKIGPSAAPALIAALKNARGELRKDIVWAIGTIGPAAHEAIPALVALLGEQDDSYAGQVLVKLGPEALQPTIGALRDGKTTQQKAGAIAALSRFGPAAAEAVPLLIAALGDGASEVRWHAAQTLSKIGPAARESLGALRTAQQDTDERVRIEATNALLKIGVSGKEAVPLLIEQLQNDRWERAHAAKALGELGADAGAAVPALAAALKQENRELRMAVVEALGKIGPAASAAVPALRAVLEAPAPRLSGSVTPLQVVGALQEEDFRIAVRETLKKIEGR